MNVHILLRASELIWVVLLSVAAKLEPCPPRDISAACAVLMIGVILVSCGAGGEVGASAVCITLLSALCSACHVITIRRAMTTMMDSARSKMALKALEQEVEQEGAGEQMGLLSSPESHGHSGEESLTDQGSQWHRSPDHQTSTAGYRCRKEASGQPIDKLPSGKVPELLMLKMLLSMIFLVPAAVLEQSCSVEGSIQRRRHCMDSVDCFGEQCAHGWHVLQPLLCSTSVGYRRSLHHAFSRYDACHGNSDPRAVNRLRRAM